MRIKNFFSGILAFALVLSLIIFPVNQTDSNLFSLVSGAESDVLSISFTGEYRQTSARNMLSLINSFRVSSDAWAYNANNQKVYYDLGELSYDYELEKIAMQRAAELVAYFSHTRPDGSQWFTAYTDTYASFGKAENIAMGTGTLSTEEDAFKSWQETDKDYSGQGHRRNMLYKDYKAIGIAHVYYRGWDYWVQEFSTEVGSSVKTTVNDSAARMNVNIKSDNITSDSLTADYTSASVKVGESNKLPVISQTISVADQKQYAPAIQAEVNPTWTVKEGKSVSISDGNFKGTSLGISVLNASFGGKKINITINVIEDDKKNFQVSKFGNEYYISKYSGNMLNVFVPSQIDGKDISFIYNDSFNSNKTIQSVKFGDGIKQINAYAFSSCPNLKSAVIPDSVTVMEQNCIGYLGVDVVEDFKIYCNKGSTAEQYAKDNNINYEYLPPHEHNYTTNIINDSTCSQTGTLVKTCEDCGQVLVEEIPLKEHSFGEWEITGESTCIEKGTKERKCSECGTVEKEYLPLGNHNYKETVVQSTCTEKGYTHHECTVCGKSYDDNETDAKGHDFEEEWVIDVPATCAKEGSKSRHCKNCDEKTNEMIIPKTEHTFGEWEITSESTCIEKGTKERKCSECGTVEKEYLPLAKHSYKETVVAPTCTEKGYIHHECAVCGKFYDDNETDAKGHDFEEEWTIDVPATCEKTGIKSHHCKNCDVKIDESDIPKSEHTFGEWEITGESTCVEKGTKERKCSECGTVEKEYLPLGNHNYKETVVQPTCTEKGYTHHECTVCGKFYDDNETEAKGHDFEEEWTVDVPATCEKTGIKSHHCKNCDVKIDESDIPKSEHNYVKTVELPTCTVNGNTTYKCSICGNSYKEEVAATGHQFDENWTIDKESTCTETGLKSHHCKNCNEKKDVKIIPKKSHTYVDVIVSPTTEKQGYTLHKCSYCGDEYRDNYTDKLSKNNQIAINDENKVTVKTTDNNTQTNVILPISFGIVSVIPDKNYTGKQIKPTIKISLGDALLIRGIDYTLTYGKNKIGKGTITIVGKGMFKGKFVKTFKINPRKTSFTAKSVGKKRITVKINKKSEASRYQVQYCSNPKFKGAKTVTVKSTKAVLKATSKKTYYVRVRTVKIIGNKKYVSSWSAAKKVKVK